MGRFGLRTKGSTRTGAHAWVISLLALALGCGADVALRPAPGAERVLGAEATAAVTSVSGVRVLADAGRWRSRSRVEEQLTPIFVSITNGGAHTLRIRYQTMQLITEAGLVFRALPPFSIGADTLRRYSAPSARSGEARLVAARGPDLSVRSNGHAVSHRFAHHRFHVAPHLYSHFRDLTPWRRGFRSDFLYYRNYYPQWRRGLPTRDMRAKALPEGVLEPQGRVAGFVYFQRLPDERRRVTFQLQLLDVAGGSLGAAEIPFVRP